MGAVLGAFIRTTVLCVNTDQMTAAAKAVAGGALFDEGSPAETGEIDAEVVER